MQAGTFLACYGSGFDINVKKCALEKKCDAFSKACLKNTENYLYNIIGLSLIIRLAHLQIFKETKPIDKSKKHINIKR